MEVGRRLKSFRLKLGLTQHSLGEAMKVSLQAIQKYESGENRLSVSRLHLATKALGMSLSEFLTDIESYSNGPK